MKKRYIVFIKLGYENINMAICNTKDIAIKSTQKINESLCSMFTKIVYPSIIFYGKII